MRVKSAKSPERIEILETRDRFSTVALRKNVKSITEEDTLTGGKISLFEYDEVKVKVRDRKDLKSYVAESFDGWFQKGEQLEVLSREIDSKKSEMNKLIKEFKQVDINDTLEMDRNILYEGIAETYLDLARIEEAVEASMLAAWELYEMLDEIIVGLEEGK